MAGGGAIGKPSRQQCERVDGAEAVESDRLSRGGGDLGTCKAAGGGEWGGGFVRVQ